MLTCRLSSSFVILSVSSDSNSFSCGHYSMLRYLHFLNENFQSYSLGSRFDARDVLSYCCFS